MKRDMELIRKMVLFVEDSPTSSVLSVELEGFSEQEIRYHGYLLAESGLVGGRDVTTLDSSCPQYVVTHLTPSGHDFAESARNPHIWDEAIEDIRKKGAISVTLEVVQKLLDKRLRKFVDSD